ncbi:MAG: hypothetical protein Q7I97_09915 [Thermovirgaceae bacterium]|nr:hypothetical protein [Thermovirgaceae bacterium]
MKQRRPDQKILIMDACVLIDFLNSDRKIFKLISEYVGTLYVASPVVDEINGIESEEDLIKMGLEVVEPEIEDAYTAGSNVGPLSFQDWVCLLTAKRLGLICVTNDKKLIHTCEKEGVGTLRGLRLVTELHKVGGIADDHALRIGRAIHESNPYHITTEILVRFEKTIAGH